MDEIKKSQLMLNLAERLPIFRKTLCLSQGQLADMVGVSRSTITHIENGKEMGWNTFLSLILIFMNNRETNELLDFYHIYTDDLNEFIKFSKNSDKRSDTKEN